ncbi:hypothetical protein NUW54_g11196 [Trametes sanguinea]|uniref:Uncharacterized protein n=1 Tax=Trametes sanguinea TaxID=158606 RepID=A0ACC1NKL4_9APHY|nr:hypothetical protein NUW54_g11196 [Trametes sanguinea]
MPDASSRSEFILRRLLPPRTRSLVVPSEHSHPPVFALLRRSAAPSASLSLRLRHPHQPRPMSSQSLASEPCAFMPASRDASRASRRLRSSIRLSQSTSSRPVAAGLGSSPTLDFGHYARDLPIPTLAEYCSAIRTAADPPYVRSCFLSCPACIHIYPSHTLVSYPYSFYVRLDTSHSHVVIPVVVSASP